jgi:hypothetical protein
MNEEAKIGGPQPVAFEVKQPIAAVVKGGPLLEEVYYVNHGQGLPVPGPPGKGPQVMFMQGMSSPAPGCEKMIGAGLYGLLAMQMTILLNEIAILQKRVFELEKTSSPEVDPMGALEEILGKKTKS